MTPEKLLPYLANLTLSLRLNPSMNGCGFSHKGHWIANTLQLWSSLKTGPARPGNIKIVLVITAVDFDQFSLYSTGTSLFSNGHV